MALLSAFEDFVMRTLGTLSGPWSRLSYIGRIRRNGQYEHWGLSRAYGDQAAGAAIAEAHTQVWLEVLRTPLAKLDAEQSDAGGSADGAAGLRIKEDTLIPPRTDGGSRRHFNSILLALSLLCRKAKGNNPPAA